MTTVRCLCLLSIACVTSWAQEVGNIALFASGTALNVTQPEAVGVLDDPFQQTIWVSYTNGATTTGDNGSSTVVEYSIQGRPLHRYTISGSVDGLKESPDRRVMWALQNKGGNAALTIIARETGITPQSPLPYAIESSTRGYRDAAFLPNRTLLSYTNPSSPNDATVQQIVGDSPPIPVNDVLTAGATGRNIATGETGQPTSQIDPGSLRVTPLDSVMLVSGANGQLIFIQNVNTPQQSVSFLNVLDPSGTPVTGVGDAIFPAPGQGLFFLTNSSKNQVLLVYLFDITQGQLLALVDSMNALVKIDLSTGVATTVLGNLSGYERMAALKIPGE